MSRSPAETAHLLTLDLYGQVLALRQENERLRAQAESRAETRQAPVAVEGDVQVYSTDSGFVVADGGGWLEGVYASVDEALAAVSPSRASILDHQTASPDEGTPRAD